MGEEWQNSEDTAFQPEEVEPLLNDVVAKVLANEVYDESKVATWVDRICDQSMQKLTQMNKPFKYVVTCILMQKNGAGVHTGQSCFGTSRTTTARASRILWRRRSRPTTRGCTAS